MEPKNLRVWGQRPVNIHILIGAGPEKSPGTLHAIFLQQRASRAWGTATPSWVCQVPSFTLLGT